MAMRQNVTGGEMDTVEITGGFKLRSLVKNATAEMQIEVSWPPVLRVDPAGGAKTILLPAEAASKDLTFFIFNMADAAENLTVEEDSSTTAIIVLAQNEGCMVHCDGANWKAMQITP